MPQVWSDEGVAAAQRGLEHLRAAVKDLAPNPSPDTSGESALTQFANQTREKFITAMDDDLGTAQAIAGLYDLAREINRARGEGVSGEMRAPAQATLRELADVLGLTLKEPVSDKLIAAPFIELLITVRKEMRAAKQFALADKIRDQLAELGVMLEDGPQGTSWKSR